MYSARRPVARLPAHCRPPTRARREVDDGVVALQRMLRQRGLHSVCEEARCPNRSRCFAAGTVTFMLLGSICTRACRFCNVATGVGEAVDPEEPARVAAAALELGLAHVVLTSVNRDDLPDQGSGQFVASIAALRKAAARTTIEVLTPDFRGDSECIERVARARPEVYNHNVETVPRLYPSVRIGARYERSLRLLEGVKSLAASSGSGVLTKSGLMVGLGETRAEVEGVLSDLASVGVDAVTVGQYLRPTLRHLPVERYLDPLEFDELAEAARGLGFRYVASGPLVRSSFHADEALRALGLGAPRLGRAS